MIYDLRDLRSKLSFDLWANFFLYKAISFHGLAIQPNAFAIISETQQLQTIKPTGHSKTFSFGALESVAIPTRMESFAHGGFCCVRFQFINIS